MRATDVLGPHRVVPVVVLDDAGRADDLGAALVAGGLPVAEVTFRTPGRRPRCCAGSPTAATWSSGAGTVITAEQVDRAHQAGRHASWSRRG